jgi:hypothetical protein
MTNILAPRLAVAGLTLALAFSAYAAVPVAEQILPDDTLAMISAPDCTKLRAASAESPMGQLWSDAALKPFREKFMAKLNDQFIEPLERELGVKLDEYAELAQGQFTLAVTANGWSGEKDTEPAAVLLIDSGTKRAELEKALATFRKKWTDSDRTLRTEEIRGVEFLAFKFSSNDVPATVKRLLPGASNVEEAGDEEGDSAKKSKEKKSEILLGRSGSVLVAGDNARALERVLSRLTGGSSPVLADVPQFQSCQPVFFREAQLFGWANAQRLTAALTKVSARETEQSEEAPDPFAKMQPQKVLEAAGLSGLRDLAFAVQSTSEGAFVQFHVGVPESERKGVLKILAGEPKETTPPPFVPADVTKFSRWRMDGQKAWTTLTSALNQISPMFMSVTDYFLNTANEAGKLKDENFDLRRQMIGNFSDDIITFEKKASSGSNAAPSLVMIGSKAPEEMAAAMKVLFGALSRTGSADEREFLGRKIYTVAAMATPQMDPTAMKQRKMHLSYTGAYVLIANDEAVLEEYLRSSEPSGKPLSEVAGVLAAAQKVSGPGTSFFSYENQQETERVRYEEMRKLLADETKAEEESGMTPIPESFGVAMPKGSIKEWFDYSLLPPFDAVAKYYSFVVMGGSADAEGLTLKIYSPVPPGLRK